MDVTLYIEVVVDGATFRFGSADRATARMTGDTSSLVAMRLRKREHELGRALTDEERQALATVDEADLPLNIYESLCETFVEGVRGWEGVFDRSRPRETGVGYELLPCTPETIREFPSHLKIQVASAYQRARSALEEKRGSADGQATS